VDAIKSSGQVRLAPLADEQGLMVNQDNSENPFKSPVDAPNPQTRPSPNAVLCGVAVVLVVACIGLLFVEPGVGILALLLVCPGLLRWFVSIRRSLPQRGVNLQSVSAIAISILMMIPIAVAGYVGFGVFFLAACSVMPWSWGPNHRPDPYGLAALSGPSGIGILGAVLTFGIIYWLVLPKRGAATEATSVDLEEDTEEGKNESE